jgi:hypothetical protein
MMIALTGIVLIIFPVGAAPKIIPAIIVIVILVHYPLDIFTQTPVLD